MRLAQFSVQSLDIINKEKLKQLKTAEYQNDNEDFGLFLEWLDYQYEAFLVNKQLEELQSAIQSFKESGVRYNGLLEEAKFIEDE